MIVALTCAALWFASVESLASAQTIALEDTAWTLTRVSGRALAADRRSAVLTLDSKQRRAFGFAGCNNFSAQYRVSRSTVRFRDIASTRKRCVDAAVAKVEDAYLAELSRIRSWRIRGTTLSLTNAAGRVLLTFERSADPDRRKSPVETRSQR